MTRDDGGRKRGERTTCPASARASETTWDISDVDSWGPDRHELGATIPDAGNSANFLTGGWRSMVPGLDVEKCDGCMLCYFYCPDASIMVANGKAAGFDLDHCKGCGICAKECPTGAIHMEVEEKE